MKGENLKPGDLFFYKGRDCLVISELAFVYLPLGVPIVLFNRVKPDVRIEMARATYPGLVVYTIEPEMEVMLHEKHGS